MIHKPWHRDASRWLAVAVTIAVAVALRLDAGNWGADSSGALPSARAADVDAAADAEADAEADTNTEAEAAADDTPDDAEVPKKQPSAANSFNRLLKKAATASNAPPAEDGIHDADNSGTHLLQWPTEAFQDLPRSNDGNHVDWVKALDEGLIAPLVDLEDPEAEAFTMDLTIVREVKGSMPDVVYPHQQHTEWLDCTNCHDEIFIPEKGKNQISMAGILLGQKCGVCHGKVAFPVSDCRRCHSKPKTDEQLKALAEKSAWRQK